MASRALIVKRNHEIQRIYWHLRRIEKRQPAYAIELIREHYFLEESQIYKVLAREDVPKAIDYDSASTIYKFYFTDGINSF